MDRHLVSPPEFLDIYNCDECRRIAEEWQPGLNRRARQCVMEHAEEHLRWQHRERVRVRRQATHWKLA